MASHQNDRLSNTFGVQSPSFSGSQSNANTNSSLSSSEGMQTLNFQVQVTANQTQTQTQTQTPFFEVSMPGHQTQTPLFQVLVGSNQTQTQTFLFQVLDNQTQTPLFQIRFGGCSSNTNTNTPNPNSGFPLNTNTNTSSDNRPSNTNNNSTFSNTNTPHPNSGGPSYTNTNSLFSNSGDRPSNTNTYSTFPNTNTNSLFSTFGPSNTNTNSPFLNTNSSSFFSSSGRRSSNTNMSSPFGAPYYNPPLYFGSTNTNSPFSNTNTNSLFSNPFSPSSTNSNSLFQTQTPTPHFQLRADDQTQTHTPFPILRMAKKLQLETKHNNFVFSPCSIQLAMSLIAHGAKGSTLDELLTFLQVESLDQLTSVASNMVAVLTQHQLDVAPKAPKLSFVGGAWVDHSLFLSPSFISCAENIYKLKAEAVNFKYQAQEVVDKVNKWAEESTGGLIKSVLTKLAPDSTVIVLANALYFKGTWKETFSKSRTRVSHFYLHNGETVQVPFMCSSEDQFIRTFDDVKVLRLPYVKDDRKKAGLSMYIILPHERDGLWSLVDKVGSDPHFLEKYTTNNTTKVEVNKFMVPKFKMTCDFDASQFLKGVGLKFCFSEEAEFDNMILNPKREPLYVSAVQHKSYIEIDEEGTEAAAVTVVPMFGCARPMPPPARIDFVADHPFMFMIKDEDSGMVLFMGHVINPLLIE